MRLAILARLVHLPRAMSRPPRLSGFDYCGFSRYFLTWCTHKRGLVFNAREVVDPVLAQIRRTAAEESFALLAYCFMPDHVHLLMEGCHENADLRQFAHRARMHSGFDFAQRFGQRLWQHGYYDRVLRNDESTREVARYVLANPVRAGLVGTPEEYPYSGSDALSMVDLLASL